MNYFVLFVPFVAILLSMSGPRTARFVAIFAEHRAADLWLKRHGIVPSAVVTNDLKTLRCTLAQGSLFRTASRTALRLHHVTLIKYLLIFFAKDKNIFALNTRDFDIRHRFTSKKSGLSVVRIDVITTEKV